MRIENVKGSRFDYLNPDKVVHMINDPNFLNSSKNINYGRDVEARLESGYFKSMHLKFM